MSEVHHLDNKMFKMYMLSKINYIKIITLISIEIICIIYKINFQEIDIHFLVFKSSKILNINICKNDLNYFLIINRNY